MQTDPTTALLRLLAGCLACTVLAAADEMATGPLDLAPVANMGFADPVAGDGQGGWSDQGPDNDFADFDHRRRDWAGVPIDIVDPARNAGRAVATLRGTHFPQGPMEVSVAVPPGTKGRYLYLLHASTWNTLPAGEAVGALTVADRNGGPVRCEVLNGRDLADWWNSAPLANGWVAEARPHKGRIRGAYLSCFDLGREVEASTVTFASTGRATWILIGATLAERSVELPSARPLVMLPTDTWRPIATARLEVQPGSALDFSALVGDAPAGRHGRVVATRDGHLAFAEAPERPVRFLGCSTSLENNPELATTDGIDRYLAAVRRQGYNLLRPHFLDHALMAGASEALAFNPEVLARFDHLVRRCTELGIYLYLDAMTSWSGYMPVNGWSREGRAIDLKSKAFDDAQTREHWRSGVRQLLTRPNPLTGTTLAEDPVVAAILPFNEQDIPLWHKGGKGPSADLLRPWRAFLQERYADERSWRDAWRGPDGASLVPADETRATASLFTAQHCQGGGTRGADATRFLMRCESGMADWYIAELRALGYRGLITQFDFLKELFHTAGRSRSDAVAMHSYCMHPTSFNRPGSRIGQISSLTDGLGWLTGTAATRQHGKPFLVTEHGHVYWTRHRGEEGLAMGAVAALQDWDLLMAHANPVRLAGQPIRPFGVGDDPVARASQVVQTLLFLRGDLAPSPHRVVVPVAEADLAAHPAEALASSRANLALVCGLAIGHATPAGATPPDAVLPFAGGSQVESSAAASTVTGGSDDGSMVGALRRAGILPAGNPTDPSRGLFVSDTGELRIDAPGRLLSVATPRTCGVVGAAPLAGQTAGALSRIDCDVPAAVVASSLDGLPLAASRRVLLVLATDARNQGEAYADQDGIRIDAAGTLPVLLRCGRFSLTLAGPPGQVPSLHPLALDGSRLGALPAAMAGDGSTTITIDTAALPGGPTPFFELLRGDQP